MSAKKINHGGAAHPRQGFVIPNGEQVGTADDYGYDSGMTLHQVFMAAAIQGICVNVGRNGHHFSKPEEIARVAMTIASAGVAAYEPETPAEGA